MEMMLPVSYTHLDVYKRQWTYTAGIVADWVAQFSFGFYSLMLTSLLLGLIVMEMCIRDRNKDCQHVGRKRGI